jgi:transcriptional regulator with XRE-family HTH domain
MEPKRRYPMIIVQRINNATREQLRLWLAYYVETNETTRSKTAKKLGVSKGAISDYLNGVKPIGFETFVKMHEKLGLSANHMLDGPPPPLKRPIGSPYPASEAAGARGQEQASGGAS